MGRAVEEAKLYVSNPVVIEAKQWDGTASNAGEIIDWSLAQDGIITYRETNETPDREHAELRISTLEGVMSASPTDWIIKGLEGEFYPCKDSVFQTKYRPLV